MGHPDRTDGYYYRCNDHVKFPFQPTKGALERVKRIYGYLMKMHNATIRFRTEDPDYSNLPPNNYDWDLTVYKGVKEEIPENMP